MIERKKKLRLIQIILLALGLLIIFFTYYGKKNNKIDLIISDKKQKEIKEQFVDSNQKGDIFYNIEYSGLDLAGNRYFLKSKEAYNDSSNQEMVSMRDVEAIFYFKDNTVLNVKSDEGVYNNKSLDMIFKKNVKAVYEGSELFAGKAEYSNSGSYLIISDKVKVKDLKGSMYADKLFFDIKKQTLNIASFNEGKINANINLKWKKVLEF